MFSTALISSPGGRTSNQDSADYRLRAAGGCWVVADGLGGHRAGERAAAIAVQAVLEQYDLAPAPDGSALAASVQAANERIVEAQREDPSLSDMRTTIAVLASDSGAAAWCYVGDSRIYAVGDGRIQALTKDHSVPQAMADAGEIGPEEIRFHEDRSRLLRALGAAALKSSCSGKPLPISSVEAFLLCTDGFWEHCTELEMEAEYTKAADPADWLHRMEARVRRRASGEYDNYTAIAVFINHAHGEAA